MHDSWAVRAVQHDQLEEVAGLVRAEHEIPLRVLANLFHDLSVVHCVADIPDADAVTKRRAQNLHVGNRTTKPFAFNELALVEDGGRRGPAPRGGGVERGPAGLVGSISLQTIASLTASP